MIEMVRVLIELGPKEKLIDGRHPDAKKYKIFRDGVEVKASGIILYEGSL